MDTTDKSMTTEAVVFHGKKNLQLETLDLCAIKSTDVVVDVHYSGVSSGTERLLWSGDMPAFPGMGYPLVPGYEAVGSIVARGENSDAAIGETVFVPGSRCFKSANGLFGGAASRLVVPDTRVVKVDEALGEQAILLALAATAMHALRPDPNCDPVIPQLIIGHGVLGRLLARLTVALGDGQTQPVVWETNPIRIQNSDPHYRVCHPDDDDRFDYTAIYDVSGDSTILDSAIARLSPQGSVVLAGFYHEALKFAFPPAFMREATIRISAEWKPADLEFVQTLISEKKLNLDSLITHRQKPCDVEAAYQTAFTEASCLKMILDWRTAQ